MIKIISVGKIKENYLAKICDGYVKKINKYHPIKVIEVPFKNDLKKEKEAILKNIKEKETVFLLAISGKSFSSEQFSELLDNCFIKNSNITLIIGGSNGVDDEIKKLAKQQISFSKMTFPHQMFRLILFEQIYRAFKILNNEPYHK